MRTTGCAPVVHGSPCGWGFATCRRFQIAEREGHPSSATFDTVPATSEMFDEPNLVSSAGLVPMVPLA